MTQLRSVVSMPGFPTERTTSPAPRPQRRGPESGLRALSRAKPSQARGGRQIVHTATLTAQSPFWYGRPRSAGERAHPPVTVRVTARARGAAIATHVHRLVRHLWVIATAAVLVVLVARPPRFPGRRMLRNLAAIQINAVVENAAPSGDRRAAREDGRRPAGPDRPPSRQVPRVRIDHPWGNQLTPYIVPKAGSTAADPPGPGALVPVQAGETPDQVRRPAPPRSRGDPRLQRTQQQHAP